MILKVKKLYKDAKLPTRKNPSDAGWDVYAHSMKVVGEKYNDSHPHLWRRIEWIEYGIGLAIRPIDGTLWSNNFPFLENTVLDGEVQTSYLSASPEGDKFYTYLAPRSSVREVNLQLCNSFGTVDREYKNEVLACFRYQPQPEDYVFFEAGKHPCLAIQINYDRIYKVGDKCAQLIVTQQPFVQVGVFNDLGGEDRGGGHGSSGRT